MAYQPTPFSLIMPEVPAHMSDGDIAKLWYTTNAKNEKGLANIRSIQMEPFMRDCVRYNRVTIHFDDFDDVLGHTGHSSVAFREQIRNGEYMKCMATFYISANITFKSYLLPCETPQPPRTEYSHVVALQLQDVVRQQAEQIRRLEARLNEMETRIHEGTKLQLDINQSNTDKFDNLKKQLSSNRGYSKRIEDRMNEIESSIHVINDIHVAEATCLETRINSYEAYNNHIKAIIMDLEAKQEAENKLQRKEKEELKQKIDALTEWCSQPIWKRTRALVLPEEPDNNFVSEV